MSSLNAVYDKLNATTTDPRIKLILDAILKLRKTLSYSKIGFRLNLNKSAVYHLEHGDWIPKDSEVIERILLGVRELEK